MVATPILARAKLSVPVNGVWVPFRSVAEAIRRFCTPAFFHHEGEEVFDISHAGTAFLFRYGGRNLALCTRHQLGKGDGATKPHQFTVTLVEPNGGVVGLSPNFATQVKMENIEHASLQDMLLLEYEDTRGGRNLRGLFLDLDLDNTLETVVDSSIKIVFSIGYPTIASELSFKTDDDGVPISMKMALQWVKPYLTFAEPDEWDPPNRRMMISDQRADQEMVEPDGMSGAPVFFIWQDNTAQAHLGFAGMITHAVRGRYALYDGVHVRLIVKGYLASRMG